MKTNFKFTIHRKMLVFILATAAVIYTFSVGYIAYTSRELVLEDAKKFADSEVEKYANITKADLNVEMMIARAIAQAFHGYKEIPSSQRKVIYNNYLKNIIDNNPMFLSTWVNWELSAIDSSWNKPYGRYRVTFYRVGEDVRFKENILDTTGDNINSSYYKMKMSGVETVLDPYFYSYTKQKKDEILETSVCSPIKSNGKFVGVAGIDLALSRFHDIIAKVHPFDQSYAFLIANDGALVAYPQKKFIGKKFTDIYKDFDKKYKINDNIKKGEVFSFTTIDTKTGKELYYSFSPVIIGDTKTPWAIGLTVPVEVIMNKAQRNFYISLFIGLFGLIVLSIVVSYISKTITKPLHKASSVLMELAKGDIEESNKLEVETNDEIGEIADSVNTLIDGLSSTAVFAKQIGEGKLDAEYKKLSNNDILGNSLIEMRESLKKAEIEDNLRKIEDEKRNWATQGLAKFGDILRENVQDLNVLSYNIIFNLIKYLNANQGGIFLLNDENEDEEKFLELKSCFAYDRQRYLQRKILIGEGLVGTCFLERKTIYLTEVPKKYIEITSGLGGENPSEVLIVPLKLNEDIYGVIEIASFKHFDDFQIEFVEKLSESISSTISSAKISARTSYLLKQSQKQAEEMRAQEEEMRQNMEELHATQEEMTRKELEMSGLFHALNSSSLTVEYDLYGKVLNVNDSFAKILGERRENLIGRHHSDGFEFNQIQKIEYEKFWSDLRNGIAKKEINKLILNGNDMWLFENYVPVYNKEGKPYKIIKVATDITESKHQEKELERQKELLKSSEEQLKQNIEEINAIQEEITQQKVQLEGHLDAINNSLGTIELTMDGVIITANEHFLKMTEISFSEIEGKNHSDFMQLDKKENIGYKIFWTSLKQGISQSGAHQYYFNGKEKWFYENFTPVKDGTGKFYKIIGLVNDITKVREKEQDLIKQLEEAKREIERLKR